MKSVSPSLREKTKEFYQDILKGKLFSFKFTAVRKLGMVAETTRRTISLKWLKTDRGTEAMGQQLD